MYHRTIIGFIGLAALSLLAACDQADNAQATNEPVRKVEPPKTPDNFFTEPPAPEAKELAPAKLTGLDPIDFKPVDIAKRAYDEQSVILSNTGDLPLTFSDFDFSGDGAFTYTENTCQGELAPGATCKLAMRFSPPDVGEFGGHAIIVETREIHRIALSGRAFVPPPPPEKKKPAPPPPPPLDVYRDRILNERNVAGPLFKPAPRPSPVLPPTAWKMTSKDYLEYKQTPSVTSNLPVDRSFIITMDRPISVVLDHEINSELPGIATFIVDETILGTDGQSKLIERGDSALGRYEPLQKVGDERLNICLFRLIRLGDGAHVYDSADECFGYIVDSQGRTGLIGEVDNRWWEQYGGAFITAGISGMATYGMTTLSTAQELKQAGQTLTDQLGQITAKMVEKTMDLAPRVTVRRGEPAGIQLLKDIYLRRPVPQEGGQTNENG